MNRVMLVATALLVLATMCPDALGSAYTCPVCKTKFDTGIGHSPPVFSRDRDFFVAGNEPSKALLLCPSCSFLSRWSLFREPRDVPDETVSDIRRTMRAFLDRFPARTVEELPSWRKCELSALLSIVLKMGPRWIAWEYLRAAWAVRYLPGIYTADNPRPRWSEMHLEVWKIPYSYWSRAEILAPSFLRADVELTAARLMEEDYHSRSLPREERPYWVMEFADAYRDHGEHEAALAYLDRLERDFAPLPADLRSMARAMRLSIALEKQYQRRVIEHFSQYHDSGRVPADSVAEVRYLIGETHRRLGERREAERWYRKVHDAPLVIGKVKAWTERGLRDIGSRCAPTAAQQKKLDAASARSLLRYVHDPRIRWNEFMISDRLDSIRDPSALVAALLEATAHPHPEVRCRAVECLRRGSPRVVERLCALLQSDPDAGVRTACLGQMLEQDWPCESAVPSIIEAYRFVRHARDHPPAGEEFLPSADASGFLTALALLGGPEATAFLFERARQYWSDSKSAKKASDLPFPDDRRDLIEALGILGNKAAIPLLIDVLESTPDEELRKDIGESLELITNRHFGFGFTEWGLRGEDDPLPSEDPLENWKTWWQDHRNESVETWRREGFRFYGYDPGRPPDPPRLSAYVAALGDARAPVRFHAWRELSQLVRHLFGSRFGRPSPHENVGPAYLRARYHQWLRQHQDRLVWNQPKRRYDLK